MAVLLVSGEHDEVRPHLTAAMHERLRHGERVALRGLEPHAAHRGARPFLAVVRDFLERCEA